MRHPHVSGLGSRGYRVPGTLMGTPKSEPPEYAGNICKHCSGWRPITNKPGPGFWAQAFRFLGSVVSLIL